MACILLHVYLSSRNQVVRDVSGLGSSRTWISRGPVSTQTRHSGVAQPCLKWDDLMQLACCDGSGAVRPTYLYLSILPLSAGLYLYI